MQFCMRTGSALLLLLLDTEVPAVPKGVLISPCCPCVSSISLLRIIHDASVPRQQVEPVSAARWPTYGWSVLRATDLCAPAPVATFEFQEVQLGAELRHIRHITAELRHISWRWCWAL